jgi:hypothetical protein
METNPRGIPHAPFIVGIGGRSNCCDAYDSPQSSVEEHVGGPDAEVESTLKQFQEAIAYVLVHCAFKMSVLMIAHPMYQQVSIHGVKFATTQEGALGKDP